METRANYALIGLFTLSVFAGILGFVYWFASGRSQGVKTSYRVVFTGSVSGLGRGSVVRFNGLRVGEVITIDLLPTDPSRVTAVIEVDERTPVKNDTRARLEYQGLTGQASVQLSGGSPAAPALTAPDGGRAVIFADRSDFQDILETAQRIAGRVDVVLGKIEKVVSDNEASVGSTIQSVETFAKALADNSAGVSAFLASVGEAGQRISSLSGRLETLSATAEELLRNVDGRSVNRTIANVESFTQALSDNRANIDGLLADSATLAKRLSQSAEKLDGTLTEIEKIAKAVDPAKLGRTIDSIDRVAGVVSGNASEIDKALKDAGAISGSLRVSSQALESVLSDNRRNIDGILTDGATLAKRLSDSTQKLDGALTEIERLAKAVDAAKVGNSIDNIDRFTTALGRNAGDVDKAMKDVAVLTGQLRGSADRLDSVLAAAQKFLGANEGAGQGAFGEIAETAKSFRALSEQLQMRAVDFTEMAKSIEKLARNLDVRTGQITAGINKLTSGGGRDLEALAAETRRAVSEVNRLARGLARDPSQLITGGRPAVPEYSGSR